MSADSPFQDDSFQNDQNNADDNSNNVSGEANSTEFTAEVLADSSVGLVEEETPSQTSAGNCCEKCQATGQFTNGANWCKKCGYYPMLGTFIDVDPDDELFEKEPDSENETETENKTNSVETYLDFFKSLPTWVWITLGGVAGLLALSVAIHLTSPAVSNFRMIWALSQIGVGIVIFLFVHFRSYVYEVVENDSLGFTDLVYRPLEVWKATIRDIKTQWPRVAKATWSTMAILFAIVIIGGIPYHKVWEIGPEKSTKKNLIKAITENIESGEGDVDELGNSIEEFAGTPGTEDATNQPIDKPKITVECVVIGYTPRKVDGKVAPGFQSLLLASLSGGKLKYAGSVSGPFAQETREQINSRLGKLSRPRPYVKCYRKAMWLRPVITCEVQCSKINENNTLEDTSFKKLLEIIDVKKK